MVWLALLTRALALDAERTELQNGVDVVIHTDASLNRTLAAVVLDLGVRDDPFEASGRAALVARLLYAGRAREAPWAGDLSEIGAVGTFFLESERTTILREAPAAPGVLDLLVYALADGLAHPPVAYVPLHARILFGSGWWSGAYASAKRQILGHLDAAGGGTTRAADAEAGPLVAESLARWTDPAKLTVYVVGPVPSREAMATVTRGFSRFSKRTVELGASSHAGALQVAPTHPPVHAEMPVPVEEWLPTAPPIRDAAIPIWMRAWRLPGAAPVELQVAIDVLSRRLEPLGLHTRQELGRSEGSLLLFGAGEAGVSLVEGTLRALGGAGPATSEIEAVLASWRLRAVADGETTAGRFARLRACADRGPLCPEDALGAGSGVTPERVAAAVRAWLRTDRGRWFAPGAAGAAPPAGTRADRGGTCPAAPNCGLPNVSGLSPPDAAAEWVQRPPTHVTLPLTNGRSVTVADRPGSGIVVVGLRFLDVGAAMSADALAALALAWGAAPDPMGADVAADCRWQACSVTLVTTPDHLEGALAALRSRLTTPLFNQGALARERASARAAWDAGRTEESALFRALSPQRWSGQRPPEVPRPGAIATAAREILKADARLVAVGDVDHGVLTAALAGLPAVEPAHRVAEIEGPRRIFVISDAPAPSVEVTWATPTGDPVLQRLLWRFARTRLEARLRDDEGYTSALEATFAPTRVTFSADLLDSSPSTVLALEAELSRLAEGIPESERSATLHGALGLELDWTGSSVDLAAILLDGAPDPAALVARARALTMEELNAALRVWLSLPKTWVYSARQHVLDALAVEHPPDVRWGATTGPSAPDPRPARSPRP